VPSLPTSIRSRVVVVVTWLNLIAQIGIVGTGGLVRLTASGLGCPTWPRCTEDSFVNTPEMGIHGVIEFGNRLLTFVLLAIVVAQLVVLWKSRRQRRDLWWLSIALLAGIPVQAVIGGISVWTQLNPYVVGLHFIVSAILVSTASVLLSRLKERAEPSLLRDVHVLSWAIGLLTAIVVTIGVLTTGAGPHAGDADAPRNGLDGEVLQHFHSWPAYAVVGLIAFAALRSPALQRKWWLAVLGLYGVQITIGIAQSRLGLPIEFVAVHIVLSMIVVATVTAAIYRSATSGSSATAMKTAVK
jgi:cytochrome c oxidase assembly protein subunit 15